MIQRLFLSYSRQDITIAKDIYAVLNAIDTATETYEHLTNSNAPHNLSAVDQTGPLWFDLEDITPGEDWKSEVKQGLDTSDGLLLIASQFAMQSTNVRDEWLYGVRTRKPIFAWVIDNCTLDPELLRYEGLHVTDMRHDPLEPRLWIAEWMQLQNGPPFPDDAADRVGLETPRIPDYVARPLRYSVFAYGLMVVAWGLLLLSIVPVVRWRDERVLGGLLVASMILLVLPDIFFLGWLARRLKNRQFSPARLMFYTAIYILTKSMPSFCAAMALFPEVWLAWRRFLQSEMDDRSTVIESLTFTDGLVFLGYSLLGYFVLSIWPMVVTWFLVPEEFERGAWSPLYAWLPHFPTGKTAMQTASDRDTAFLAVQVGDSPITAKQAFGAIFIVYHSYDLHFASYLMNGVARHLSALPVNIHLITTTQFPAVAPSMNAESDLILFCTSPHSYQWLPTTREQFADVEVVPVLMQQPQKWGKWLDNVQWVDARSDYQGAVKQLAEVVQGNHDVLPQAQPAKLDFFSRHLWPQEVIDMLLPPAAFGVLLAVVTIQQMMIVSSQHRLILTMILVYQLAGIAIFFRGYWQRVYSAPMLSALYMMLCTLALATSVRITPDYIPAAGQRFHANTVCGVLMSTDSATYDCNVVSFWVTLGVAFAFGIGIALGFSLGFRQLRAMLFRRHNIDRRPERDVYEAWKPNKSIEVPLLAVMLGLQGGLIVALFS